MDKVTPDPPNTDIQASPRTPSTMYTVNPTVDVQTLLGSVSESLASASVITMDIADRETGPSRNSLLGVHQILMLAELSVNRALDQLDPIAQPLDRVIA
ncbi:DUF6124 family protein [Pseudomonas sp. LB3P31]